MFSSFYYVSPLLHHIEGCSSSSQICTIWESTISLAVRSDLDEDVVERATLEEIQNFFLDDFNEDNLGVTVTLIGPIVVSTDFVLRLENVNRIMNGEEIEFFEETVMEVLNAELENNGAMISSTRVFLQLLTTTDGSRRYLEDGKSLRNLEEVTSNDVFVRADGQCRSCTSEQFGLLTNDAIGSGGDEIRKKLNEGPGGPVDSTGDDNYFEDVEVTVVAGVEEQPDTNTDDETSSIVSRIAINEFPYWVLFVLAGGVFIVVAGVCYVGCIARRLRKQDIAKLRERSSRPQRNRSRWVPRHRREARGTLPQEIPKEAPQEGPRAVLHETFLEEIKADLKKEASRDGVDAGLPGAYEQCGQEVKAKGKAGLEIAPAVADEAPEDVTREAIRVVSQGSSDDDLAGPPQLTTPEASEVTQSVADEVSEDVTREATRAVSQGAPEEDLAGPPQVTTPEASTV